MPKLTDAALVPTYNAIERFVEVAFRSGDSIFTPGRRIWAPEVADDFYQRFVGHPDVSDAPFMEKFQRQLRGAPATTIQLAAEALFVHQITPWRVSQAKKESLVQEVLSWSPEPIPFPAECRQAFAQGMVGDMSFNHHRPFHLAYLFELLRAWHRLDRPEQDRILAGPWSFKKFAYAVSLPKCQPMREILLHLVFPDSFEPITSRHHKKKIAKRWRSIVTDPPVDVDQLIFEIRRVLSPQYGEGFHFYDDPIKPEWLPEDEPSSGDGAASASSTPYQTTARPAPDSLAGLANELLLDAEYLYDLERMLRSKRQLIVYGPPGTGKTYVAQRFAAYVAGASDRVRLVQFHPSFTYEDFVQGFRPALHDGRPGFRLISGPLLEMAAQAAAEADRTFVLVIDEINRGNLAKVFGELYFLLEYRDAPMRLQYSDEPFRLPPNLLLIGTMNTADRSIALIDAALRRRFFFVEFFPDRPPVQGLLGRWLARHKPDMQWVAAVVDLANKDLGSRHLAIGPSHFMRPDLNEEWVDLIWRHAVVPFIEEQFFGEPDRVEAFSLESLRERLPASAEIGDGPAEPD